MGHPPPSPTGSLAWESPWVTEWIQTAAESDEEVSAAGKRNPAGSEWILQGVRGRGGNANPKPHYKSKISLYKRSLHELIYVKGLAQHLA